MQNFWIFLSHDENFNCLAPSPNFCDQNDALLALAYTILQNIHKTFMLDCFSLNLHFSPARLDVVVEQLKTRTKKGPFIKHLGAPPTVSIT